MRILLLIFIISFCSCIQKRYIHSAPPVLNPMFRDKAEGYVGGYYMSNGFNETTTTNQDVTTSTSNGLALQGGYALNKHLGVVGSLNYAVKKDYFNNLYAVPFDTSKVYHRRSEVEIAGNYFFIDKSREVGMNFLFGATIGKLKIEDAGKVGGAEYSRYFNSSCLFFFLQPCLNFYVGKYSGVGLSTKFGYGSYDHNATNYSDAELTTLRLNQTAGLYVAEFGIKGAIGLKKIPLSIEPQVNYIWNHSGRIHVKRSNLSLGLSYHYNRK
jgi:hypothetical protein